MTEFELQGHEFITLNNLLKLLNLVESGGEANQRIEAGEVMVNGETEKQKRKKLRDGDKVVFNKQEIIIQE
jgi:ribosome-associated protein